TQPAADGERWRGAHPSPGLRAVVRRRRVGAAERATGAVARVRALARDSERNRRRFVSVGTGRMLAAAFESLAAAALVCMMQLDKEAARVLASSSSMGSRSRRNCQARELAQKAERCTGCDHQGSDLPAGHQGRHGRHHPPGELRQARRDEGSVHGAHPNTHRGPRRR
uniref:Uncharacterized protein n=1 Tax=Oryza glaberrima TaxID=4538 RepID=I1NSA5_ORYGL